MRYMQSNVIAVENGARYASLRDRTLRECYSNPGYKDLPLKEKNKIYDSVQARLKKEMGLK